MDTLCGLGLPEIVVIALLGFVLLGPERSRQMAVTAGRWLGRAMRSPWWKEFTQVTQAVRNLPTTLVRMAELEEAQADLRQTIQDIEQETNSDLNQRLEDAAGTDPWNIRRSDSRPRPTTSPTSPPQAQDQPAADTPDEDSDA